MKNNSLLMSFLLQLRLYKLAWSFRRIYCPVPSKALVLEVGSGGNPYFRSNVLLDAYLDSRERHFVPLVRDRPCVLGFVESLPFQDNTFDFVIASHVLEHSDAPDKFLSELQRVAKAGYIETPDAFMERINPYWDHRSEVTVRDDCLKIRKKSSWLLDSDLVELYEFAAKPTITKVTIPSNPFIFHVRYYWEKCINYDILNPNVDSSFEPIQYSFSTENPSFSSYIKKFILFVLRKFFSQNDRNSKIDLLSLLRCPNCASSSFLESDHQITCNSCNTIFQVKDGIPYLYKSN